MDVSIDRNPDVQLTLAVPQPDSKRSNPGDEVRVTLEKTPQRSQAPPPPDPKPRPPPPTPRPQPFPPVARPPPSQTKDFTKTFEEFANPRKLKPLSGGFEDLEDMSEPGSEMSSLPENGEDGLQDDLDQSEYSVDEPPEPEEEPIRPSPGFASIDEEKASLIFKLARAKRSGMPSSRNFNMTSDIRDMRSEFARIEHELALDASLKFQRKMLMMTVSVTEHLNARYDPFEIQLQGWSESVHNSISDYDRVFERLHEKYKSKVSMAPELELLFMVAGSAMMFHFTKTIFKQGLPGMSANPEIMASMMKAFTQATGPAPPPPATAQPQMPQQTTTEGEPQAQRREMRGPAMDLGGILGGLAGGGAMPFPPMGPPQVANPPDLKPKLAAAKTVTFAPGTKRPSPDDTKEEDDRLSDIVSDMDSIPDELSSFTSESSEDTGVRKVQIKNTKAQGRKKAKTVISL